MEAGGVGLMDGYMMPIIGFGTMDFAAEKGVVCDATREALRAGFRHLDCAAIYNNEDEVGEGLKEEMATLGLKRSDVFLTSKLPATAMRPEKVAPALEKTLKDLQVDCLDLYLVHFPIPLRKKADGSGEEPERDGFGVRDTWTEMEKLQERGLTKSIGVSNFNVMLLNDLLCYARVKPVVNQIERHPYLVQQDLVNFCKDQKIVVCAYSPLGSPGTGLANDEPEPLLKNSTILRIANECMATPAQVLISWSVAQSVPPMPKSVNPKRIAENFAAMKVNLSEEHMKDISALDKNHRYFHQKWNGIAAFA